MRNSVSFQPHVVGDASVCAFANRLIDLIFAGPSKHHTLKSGHEADFFSGGIVYKDCIVWEIFMVTKGDKRITEILKGWDLGVGGGGKWTNNGTSSGNDSTTTSWTGWNSSMEENSTTGLKGDSRAWNSTFFF